MKKRIAEAFCIFILKCLSCFPLAVINLLAYMGGFIVDRLNGDIARLAIKLALPNADKKAVSIIAKKAAYSGFSYLLSPSRLMKIPYQLHDLDLVSNVLAKKCGVIIVSLHVGPPDLGTLALAKENIAVSTLIGTGKQSPLVNYLGKHALDKAGISYIKRGNPIGILKAIRNNEAIVLHCDMRSREAPVTFFGQQTTAPISAVNMALTMNIPILFHYCTLEKNIWHLYFESFELNQSRGSKDNAAFYLQALMHKIEEVILRDPGLWIWHYDRFKLKRSIKNNV